MILDKINQFSEGKYTVDMPPSGIVGEFEEKRGDSAAVIEALSITQRFISTCKSNSHPTFHPPTLRSDLPLLAQPNLFLSTDNRLLVQQHPSAAHRRQHRRLPCPRRPRLPLPPLWDP